MFCLFFRNCEYFYIHHIYNHYLNWNICRLLKYPNVWMVCHPKQKNCCQNKLIVIYLNGRNLQHSHGIPCGFERNKSNWIDEPTLYEWQPKIHWYNCEKTVFFHNTFFFSFFWVTIIHVIISTFHIYFVLCLRFVPFNNTS